jgi:hypothetical protein
MGLSMDELKIHFERPELMILINTPHIMFPDYFFGLNKMNEIAV